MSTPIQAICDAVVAVIEGLGSPPASVEYRKDGLLLSTDSLPLCIVNYSDDNAYALEAFADDNDATNYGSVVKLYAVGISMFRKSDGKYQTETDVLPQFCRDIQKALNKPTLTGAPTVTNTDIKPFSAFAKEDLRKNYEVSRMIIVFHSSEERN